MTIDRHIQQHPILAEAASLDPADGTLSGSENALARIVDTIASQAYRLDATQLTALAHTLTAYAQEVQNQEDAAWKLINSRRNQP